MKRSAMQLCVWVAGLVLCGALGGCAVLTVDVDVYKGALVNEEHVQLHQLVALTTAAQPMLVNLRDDLEWPETDGEPPKALVSGCPTSWYQKGYVRPPEGWVSEVSVSWWQDIKEWWRSEEWFSHRKCQPYFRHAYARVVNDILGLYEDGADPDLALHGRKLREAAERLPRARPDVMGDQVRYDTIATGFKADEDLTDELRLLKEGYRELLIVSPVVSPEDGPGRKVGKLMDALKARAGTGVKGKGLEGDLIAEWKGSDAYKEANTIYDRRLPFRAVWKLLGEGLPDTLLAEATRELCQKNPTGDSACAALLARTKELADEYWASRRAVRELWEESVALLIDIERLQRESRDQYRALKEEAIRLIVMVTNVRHIASALDRLDSEGRCAILSKELARGVMCEVDPKGARVWSEQNVRGKGEAFELALQRSLSSATADTAHVLLLLDSLEKTALPNQGLANHLVKKANMGNDDRAVRLGLTRSVIDDPELQDAQEVAAIVSGVSRKLGQGFERGRMPDGLYTLIEAFLKAHNGNPGDRDSHDVRKLLDALVEFAQKMLFLANHESLVSPPETSGLILGGAEKLTRGLFGDAAVGGASKQSFVLGTSRVPEARKQQYVRVLQAVGNTILFSANELRERERYRDLSKDKGRAEIAAVQAVYSPDPQKILKELLDELRHEQDIAQKQRDEATAQKAAIDGQIGSTLSPKTGLRLAEDTALNERNKAEQDLQNYVTKQGPLKAFHDVLTQEVMKTIKARWKAAGKDADTKLAEFMTGPDGMKEQLTTIQAKNSTLTTDERRLFDEGITYVKSQEAEAAFDAYRAINGHTSLKRAELLDALAAHLRELEAARAIRMAQYEQVRKNKEQAQDDVRDRIAQLTAEATRLATVIAALPNTKARLATAATVIESVKAEVLKDAAQHGRFVSPDALYRLLATHVKRKEDAEGDASKKQPYQDTQVVLSTRTPPPGLPPWNPKDDRSPVEVMDEVIALLRHRQMREVERFGSGSEQDKKASEALENAYQHRAGMIYIRPSSAYLRTSFPSTSLQDDPNLAWDNMLLKQGIRNLPFSSQLRDILDPSVERDRALTAELDKQFWQNINRVRVSGVGFSNQALVKDDVGNWYVKQYYGDTEDIVKSAKHLALYSLGTKLPIDLSRELRKAAATKEESQKTGAEKEAELPPLQQVFGKHRTAYYAHTTDTATRLVALHGRDNEKTLHAQIVAAWKRDGELKKDADLMDAITSTLEDEVAQWDKTLDTLKKASDQERGLAITKDLRVLAKLEKQLSTQIQKLDKPEALKNRAAKEVHKVVGPMLIDLLEGHKQALDRYEQAVLFIGDAANPKDPKQEQGK